MLLRFAIGGRDGDALRALGEEVSGFDAEGLGELAQGLDRGLAVAMLDRVDGLRRDPGLSGQPADAYPEKIRALREGRGMNPTALARAAGVTAPTARRAERGEPVSVTTARSLAAVLRVNPPQRLGQPAVVDAQPGRVLRGSAFSERRRGLATSGAGTFSVLSVDAGRTSPALGCHQEKGKGPASLPPTDYTRARSFFGSFGPPQIGTVWSAREGRWATDAAGTAATRSRRCPWTAGASPAAWGAGYRGPRARARSRRWRRCATPEPQRPGTAVATSAWWAHDSRGACRAQDSPLALTIPPAASLSPVITGAAFSRSSRSCAPGACVLYTNGDGAQHKIVRVGPIGLAQGGKPRAPPGDGARGPVFTCRPS